MAAERNRRKTMVGVVVSDKMDKTVTVDGCENCLKTAISELEDLGFSPVAE